ncbi:hypothetical protein [Ligilactobacillus salivarius]|uniref:Uncharacterized protein n=1 Tax=Ligilactobacillus salivarius TaxID=1624 RepID=A0A1V9QIX5_9LACO|nr:hypothetical protein [Ligilactobacillus salivarius]OQQ80681.1 hypothetical protein B6U60_10195 [Ligilactobacillus salivarius]OQQ83450.1 hypothetical protein B6U59_09990 [Ligilactobacillus salivarius]
MEYTRKKIAEKAQVSPQKVFRYIKAHDIEPTKRVGRTDYFSEDDAHKMLAFFEEERKEREVNQTTSDDMISKDEYITVLKDQVRDLQKRLDSKEDEVSELHRLLSQEQQLARTEQAKRLELESVNTRLIETNTDVLNEKDARIQELENKLSKEQNKGFWARIFK